MEQWWWSRLQQRMMARAAVMSARGERGERSERLTWSWWRETGEGDDEFRGL